MYMYWEFFINWSSIERSFDIRIMTVQVEGDFDLYRFLWNNTNNCINVFMDTKIIVFINTKSLK